MVRIKGPFYIVRNRNLTQQTELGGPFFPSAQSRSSDTWWHAGNKQLFDRETAAGRSEQMSLARCVDGGGLEVGQLSEKYPQSKLKMAK